MVSVMIFHVPPLTPYSISPSWNSLGRGWSTLPPTQMSALPNQHQWPCPFSSPDQQESNLTFTSTSMFAIIVTFLFVILCETQVFGQWSRELRAGNLSRHLHNTPVMLPKSQGRQGKDFQQGRKSIIESSRGTGIYGSPHQVPSFPL